MWKTVLAGIAVLSISAASLAYAQQGPRTDEPRQRVSAEDRAALTDARIAGLRAGLKLTAEQEKHWPSVEAAIREMAKQRAAAMDERRTAMEARRAARSADKPAARPDAIERLRRSAERIDSRANALKKFADAAEPLYKSLDDGQKRRFSMLLRMGRGGHGRDMHHQRRG